MSEAGAINIGDVLNELNVTIPTVETPKEEQQKAEEQKPAEETVQTEAETQTEATGEDDEATVDDEQDDDAEDAETDEDEADDDAGNEKESRAVRKLTKRVDKLTARTKTAEEEAATLRTKLEETEQKLASAQPIVLQDTADILADVTSVADLDARVASANVVIDEVPDLIASADADGDVEVRLGDGSVKTFTKSELMARLQRAKQIVKGESAMRAFLAQREPAIAEARTEYPELFQEKHPARELMLTTLKQYPGLAKMPNVEIAIGDMINGYLLRIERQKTADGKKDAAPAKAAAATTKPKPAAPKVAPRVVSPTSAPKSATKPKGDALAALQRDGSRSAAEEFVANIFG